MSLSLDRVMFAVYLLITSSLMAFGIFIVVNINVEFGICFISISPFTGGCVTFTVALPVVWIFECFKKSREVVQEVDQEVVQEVDQEVVQEVIQKVIGEQTDMTYVQDMETIPPAAQ